LILGFLYLGYAFAEGGVFKPIGAVIYIIGGILAGLGLMGR
jgi:hypothetical protein